MESWNHFNQIADALPGVISQVVRKTAFEIQAGAASRAPVDTGFLRNSIYVRTVDESTYGAEPTKKDSYLLEQVEQPEDAQTAYIGVGANYGIYVEMGTRFTPARPYFIPAVEAARLGFEEAIAGIEAKLKEVAR